MNSFVNRLDRLYSAVVSDALDELGVRDKTMAPGLCAVGTPARLVGRAATLQVVAVRSVPAQRYTMQFQAVEALRPGEVMVVSAPDASSAFWGELITTRAMAKGCVGAVVDSYCRDVRRVRDYNFAVWARGTHPADSAGRLEGTAMGVAITCAGARVDPGDYLLADADGVVVVPAALIAEALELAEAKALTENTVRDTLRGGASLTETYDRYGVM